MALTPKQRKAALEKGLAVNLASTDETKYLSANPKAAAQLFVKPLPQVTSQKELPADGRPAVVPAHGQPRQTVDRQHSRQTVSPHYRQTPRVVNIKTEEVLPADRKTEVEPNTNSSSTLLAPVQWAVWEALREADVAGRLVSYRKLATAVNASIRGVRDALAVIEKEGGIRSKVTVRTPDEQGMRIELDALKPFQPASLKETKGLLKRDGKYRQTVDRKSLALPSDGLCLSVSITEYIKQTDIVELLRLLPPVWSIRERTLVEIARSFPAMTSLEFRRSLLLLVEQTTKSHTPVQNHNAWLKAAFAKNEGPLVTERMIEAQLDHIAQGVKGTQVKAAQASDKDDVQADLAALRRYVNATAEEREVIERVAETKVVLALRVTTPEKHSEIRDQALVEASREFFTKNPKEK